MKSKILLLFLVPFILLSSDSYNYFRGWDRNTARAGKLHITDKRILGTLSVTVAADTSLYINNDYYGKGSQNDIALPAGTYTIKTENPSVSGTITVSQGHQDVTVQNGTIHVKKTGVDKIYAVVKVSCNKRVTVYKRIFRAMVPVGKTPYREKSLSMVKCFKLIDGRRKSTETCTKIHAGEETEFVFYRSRYGLRMKKLRRYRIINNRKYELRKASKRRGYTAFSLRTSEKAKVYLNNRYFATAPFSGKYVKAGKFTIRVVSLDGKRIWTKRQKFYSRYRLMLDVPLFEKGCGAVTLDSYPSGKMFLGNRCLGYGPRKAIQLKPGRYTYRIVYKEKGVMSKGKVSVRKGTHTSVTDFLRNKIEE
jgi:hypothetical protein